MQKKTFIKGAAILGVAGVIIKFLGAVFRIPLGNIIGDTGMAYYQTAYPIYVFLLAITTAGFPTAVSRMVSERTAEGNDREAYRIFRLSIVLIAAVGAACFIILMLGSSFMASFTSPEAVYSIRAIAPALLLVPLMAAFRGYFQGLQDMMPTAVSQITEQFFRVFCGLTLTVIIVTKGSGLEYAAAGAAFGATAGGCMGLLTVFIIFLKKKKSLIRKVEETPEDMPSERVGSIIKRIVLIAIPITIGASVMAVMSGIDLLMVTKRLMAGGLSLKQATGLYGQMTGFAASLINLPQVLTQGIALSLVPAIAAAASRGDTEFKHRNMQLGLRTAMIIGMPCTVGLLVLPRQIMLLLYPTQKESALSAAGCLAVLALGVVFLSTAQALTGMLQGIGKQMVPVANLAVGAVFKIVITYVLTAIPSINIKGAAAGTVCAYAIASILNLRALKKYEKLKIDISLTFIRPIAASLIMGAAVMSACALLSGHFGNAVTTLACALLGVIVYAVMVFALKVITPDELRMIPKCGRLADISEKIASKF